MKVGLLGHRQALQALKEAPSGIEGLGLGSGPWVVGLFGFRV